MANFDRLYKLRDVEKFPHSNPMVRYNPNGVHVDGNWQHSNGDIVGNYFTFDVTEWTEYFGSFTSGVTVMVKQCRGGKAVYTGEIYAAKDGSCGGDYCGHGRKNPPSSAHEGDWKGYDYIVKPEDDCYVQILKMTPHNKQLTSQQFRITANEQIESIIYPGRVLSVAIQTTSWMCKKGDEEIGLVTVDGNLEPESSVCNSKKECNRSCTIDPTPIHDYCMDGNKVLLKDSSPNDISQKWRFYHNSIMNLACKRTPLFQGLAISQIYDNAFKDVPLFDQLELSFVNNGVAISVGEKVSLVLMCSFGIQYIFCNEI